MSPKFQADYDLNCDIVYGVLRRESSIDFQTAHEAGFQGIEDPEVLLLAAQAGRILVTQKDHAEAFRKLCAAACQSGRYHYAAIFGDAPCD